MSEVAVGISGSYGGLNLGDEAILASALTELERALPGAELVVFARNAEHTRDHHRVGRVVPARDSIRDDLVREVERLDLLLLGGGGILYDREAESYLRLARLAQQLAVPTATFAIGVGPLERAAEREGVRAVLEQMSLLTVRELPAKRLLEEIGIEQEIEVTADPAVLLEPEPCPDASLLGEGLSLGRPLVAMSVRERGGAAAGVGDSDYHALLAMAADFIVDRFDCGIVFVPLERNDIRESYAVMARMEAPEAAQVLRRTYEPRQLAGLIGRTELAVGMRLHFLIFAALSGVPVLALPYAAKVAAFLEELDQPAAAWIGGESAGALLASIDRAWDKRAHARVEIAGRMQALRERATRTAPLVARLLSRGPDVAADR